jgi:hypothetical protein
MRWLDEFLKTQGAVAGSVHIRQGEGLALLASHNLPEAVLAAVRYIPPGKGMAGQAQVRRQPVDTCNLQEDSSGDVKPGARAVAAQAAVALPVFDTQGEVRAVVGLAWMDQRQLDEAAKAALMAAAATLDLD